MKLTVEQIAEVCHEANRAYCRTLGDHSQPEWNATPLWQRASAIDGVKFHIQNPRASSSASHRNWLREKLEQGWRYGPVKDPVKKEHPCCVSFDQLPPEQQYKDVLFRAIVHSLCEDLQPDALQLGAAVRRMGLAGE